MGSFSCAVGQHRIDTKGKHAFLSVEGQQHALVGRFRQNDGNRESKEQRIKAEQEGVAERLPKTRYHVRARKSSLTPSGKLVVHYRAMPVKYVAIYIVAAYIFHDRFELRLVVGVLAVFYQSADVVAQNSSEILVPRYTTESFWNRSACQ